MPSEAHYLDASVVLRLLYRLGGPPPTSGRAVVLTSSELVRVEATLSIQRRRLSGDFDAAEVRQLLGDLDRILATLYLFPVSDEVLERSLEPFPMPVSLRAALHVGTAQLVRSEVDALTFCSWNDDDLAAAVSRDLAVGALKSLG